jgi:hypothetical protein
MKVVSGVIYMVDEHAAQQFRTMFWDWLDFQNFDVRHYWTKGVTSDGRNDDCYAFKFKWVPKHLFNQYRKLWIGRDAIYPNTAGGQFYHREYSMGRNLDPYFVDAMKYAKDNAPCLVVVDSVAAMEMAFDHLRTFGKVFSMLMSTPLKERLTAIQNFDKCEDRRSFLIVTTALAQSGWRLSRPGISLAATGLMTPDMAQQVLGRTARMSQPHGRIEVAPRSFIKTKERNHYEVEEV